MSRSTVAVIGFDSPHGVTEPHAPAHRHVLLRRSACSWRQEDGPLGPCAACAWERCLSVGTTGHHELAPAALEMAACRGTPVGARRVAVRDGFGYADAARCHAPAPSGGKTSTVSRETSRFRHPEDDSANGRRSTVHHRRRPLGWEIGSPSGLQPDGTQEMGGSTRMAQGGGRGWFRRRTKTSPEPEAATPLPRRRIHHSALRQANTSSSRGSAPAA